jgi:hypothetical protein
MTMLELSHEQRMLLAETVRDVANIAGGAMIFGQVLAERPFSLFVAVLGVALWLCLVACAIAVARKKPL